MCHRRANTPSKTSDKRASPMHAVRAQPLGHSRLAAIITGPSAARKETSIAGSWSLQRLCTRLAWRRPQTAPWETKTAAAARRLDRKNRQPRAMSVAVLITTASDWRHSGSDHDAGASDKARQKAAAVVCRTVSRSGMEKREVQGETVGLAFRPPVEHDTPAVPRGGAGLLGLR